ncbi:MAG: two-component sensor histidine kinase [Bacteroidaceae bacterium]|nr:two-component sensor histidine kinase [Bacteroidaceae bacterium]
MSSSFAKFFLPLVVLLLLLVGCSIYYYHDRERQFAELHLQEALRNVNENVYDLLRIRGENEYSEDMAVYLQRYIAHYDRRGLRLTLISPATGNVLYESSALAGDAWISSENHAARPEVVQAKSDGLGYAVRRLSTATGEEYFYVATYDEEFNFIVRSSMPYKFVYTHNTTRHIVVLFVSAFLVALLIIIMYRVAQAIGSKELATQKLLMHLSIAQEGLAFFDNRKRLLFANSLFSEYGDFISAKHLADTGDILAQPEFRKIKRFIDNDGYLNNTTRESTIHDKVEVSGRTFSLRCVLFKDGSFEVSINDITRAEEQSRIERQLTQNVAHEFKTPVCSIQGYIETILENYPANLTAEQMMHFLQRCHSQSNRLNALVQDMQNLNNMNDTLQKVKKEPVDIAQVVGSIQQEIDNKLAEQQMSVQNKLPARLLLMGDAGKIYSIFRNLFDNAVAYAGQGSVITISCFRSDARYYYFSFRDNGAGVPQEHLPRIFERFYRVDKGRSRKLGGTGLGLAIVKNAVALHGGTISAREAQGGGLEFVFKLRR